MNDQLTAKHLDEIENSGTNISGPLAPEADSHF